MTGVLWVVFVALGSTGVAALVWWGSRWGSTASDRARELPGDDDLQSAAGARVVMTRAIGVDARREEVWPWVAQIGRGAGWYSFDWLDNGRRPSAWHLVSWIPEPRHGDATAIGYLRHLEPGRSIAWWLDGVRFLGSPARLVICFQLDDAAGSTRVVSRISADASGPLGFLSLLAFRGIDSIMACRQLVGLRRRAESSRRRQLRSRQRETGRRDQYQAYEVFYADGERAGVAGRGDASWARRCALRDGSIS